MKVADCMILILGAWQKSLLLIAQSLFSILTGFYKLHTVKGGGKWQNRILNYLQSTRFTHERSTSNIHRLVHYSMSFFEKFSDYLKLGFYIRNTDLVIPNFFVTS